MSRMKRAWKIVQPKAKPSVFENQLGRTWQLKPCSNHSTSQNPDAVPSDAVHDRAKHLSPANRYILFMQPWQRSATT